MWSGVDGLAADLDTQRRFFRGRHSTYEQTLATVTAALDGEVGARLAEAWRDRRFSAAYERPLLLLASLRFDALRSPDHPLRPQLVEAAPEPASGDALAAALARPGIAGLLATRHVQTNEVSRAVAWRWPARLVDPDGARPLAIVDVGASAGLNLVAGALPAPWVDAAGTPLPLGVAPIVRRLGLDRAPLSALDDEAMTWLRACVWPGEVRRLSMLEAAIAAFRADPPAMETLDLADAPARLEALASELGDGVTLLAYQTVVRDYLAPEARAAYLAGMRAWVNGPGHRAWTELEQAPAPTREHPAALTLHTRGAERLVARCAFPIELMVEEP